MPYKRKHVFGNWAHEGLQPPSNLEERKGLKEAQHAAYVHSAARPHPPRTRGVISASLEGSPPKPSTAPRAPASLEGSEPTLGGAERLRLAQGQRAYPRESRSTPPRSRPPLDRKDKRPFRSPAHHMEALNANHSATAPRSDGVRPPLRTVAVTGVPSANSGHCSTIPDAVATLWEPAMPCKTCSALLQPLCCQLPIPPSYFPLRGTLEWHGHDPRKRLWP